jgi:hypothetical protein
MDDKAGTAATESLCGPDITTKRVLEMRRNRFGKRRQNTPTTLPVRQRVPK